MARKPAKARAKTGAGGRRKAVAVPAADKAAEAASLKSAAESPVRVEKADRQPGADSTVPRENPAAPDFKEIIARINDISGYAKGTWFALLGVLVFSGITLLGVEDTDFFAAESETKLPLVGVSVPVT